MGPEVFVDGRPVSSMVDAWGELEVTHRWPLGSWETKWSMPLDPWRRPPQLRANAPVQVKVGPHCIWCGTLVEPNWSEGALAAIGLCRQGEGAASLDNAAGQTTSTPDTAIDGAIARGVVSWTRPESISAVPLGAADQTDKLSYVSALLNAYAQSASMNWYVDPFGAVRIAADPTTPTALLMPDNGVLGVAVEAQVGSVVGRYIDSTTHVFENVTYGTGLPEKLYDWTARGEMSAAEATALCEGVWTPLQAQPGWTNGLTVSSSELMSVGGIASPGMMWKFRAGQMLRLLGVRDLRGLSANTDVVIGESIWTPGGDQLRLNPVGKVARDIRSIVEGLGGAAA